VASQLDWDALQTNNRELWLECAQRAFSDMDEDNSGTLSVKDLIASLRDKLPASEVDFAVEDALLEAGHTDAEEIDFEGFLKMLRVGSRDSLDSLDQYDPRVRYGDINADYSVHGTRLQTVPEETKPPNT
jgi:Ca2+-binding EF-hand superfamily protein